MEDDKQDEEIVKKLFDSMPEEAKNELMDMLAKAETEEDFLAFAMIGPCPRCGNELTKDGESMAENEDEGDPTVGFCPECQHQWCTDCGQEVKEGVECPHWNAWEAYCQEHDMYQGPDGELEEGYMEDYMGWLEEYIADLEASEQDGKKDA